MRILFSFLLFLLFAMLGMWWYYSCSWCLGNHSSAAVEEKIDPKAAALAKKAYEDSLALAHGLYAKDLQNNDVFRYPENLRINNTDGTVFIPDSIADFPSKIANHLGIHQDQDIIIYGYETLAEKNTGDSLGLARANFIKNLLITDGGINGDRILAQSKLEDYTYNPNGHYKGGILLNFHAIDTDRIEEIEKGIANKTLYSDFGTTSFKPDATLANYTLELKNYLTKYPSKKVLITGHTDNVGSNEQNQAFGLSRARNVLRYFKSKGIEAEKLKASSKGELAPAVPNDTPENRAKNRRIEIIVN